MEDNKASRLILREPTRGHFHTRASGKGESEKG